LALWKYAKEAYKSSIGIQMVGIQQYLFIRAEIFHPFCYGKSPKILDWMWKTCSIIGEAGPYPLQMTLVLLHHEMEFSHSKISSSFAC